MSLNIINLLEKIKENPEMEVMTMVESEVVASDDFTRWISSIGDSRLDSYYIDDEKVHFLSNIDDLREIYLDFASYDYNNENKSEKEMENLADKTWKSAIKH